MIENETLKTALAELKERLTASYPVARLILFGSVVRGEMHEESDVDALVLTARPLSGKEHDAVSDEVFVVNLRYDTNISALVVDLPNWEEGPLSVMPLRQEVEREGVEL
jgi:predicted nucleotidyltransferase